MNAADRFKPLVGHIGVTELTLADVQAAIAKLSGELEVSCYGS